MTRGPRSAAGGPERQAAAVRHRDLMCELVAQGGRMLGRDRALTDSEIHDLRRLLKRCRAVLRLLRPGIGEPEYRRLNASLRGIGRPYAPLRDARVLRDALGDLGREMASGVSRASLAGLRRALASRPVPLPSGAALQRRLEAIGRRMQRLPAETMKDDVPDAGMRKVYQRARRRFGQARGRDDEALHQWRKQTKYLHNQLLAVQGQRPRPGIARLIRESDRLGELLGSDHDLAMLMRFVADPAGQLSPHERSAVLGHIGRQRRRLQDKSFAAGERLYRRKPKAFIQDLVIRTGE